jgi:hypothetical protein
VTAIVSIAVRYSYCNLLFSWDNLPKATMVVETDYYFVEDQKLELLIIP